MHRRSIRARSLSAPLTQSRCRLCPYPVSASVSESSPGRTGRFPTCYSPVRHSSPEGPSFDLHVLGMPPAFILSQDQTLHLIRLFFFQCLFADIFFFFLFVFLFRCFSRNRRVCFFSLVLVRLIFCFFRFYQVFKDRPAVCFANSLFILLLFLPFVNPCFDFFNKFVVFERRFLNAHLSYRTPYQLSTTFYNFFKEI